MYSTMVRRKVVGIFQALGRGRFCASHCATLAPRFEHVFAGTHALGGQRHTPAAMGIVPRLFRLLPHLAFNVEHIAVSGPPWDTTIVVVADPPRFPVAHPLRQRWCPRDPYHGGR